MHKMRPLRKFRALCEQLLADGVKPTVTVLAKYGYAERRTVDGTLSLLSGNYTKVRADVLREHGWTLDESVGPHGRWMPPEGWKPCGS